MRTDVPPRAREEDPRTDVVDWIAQSWVLELPFTTPMSLNDRMHWRVKAKRTAEWREAACWLAKAAKIPPCRRVEVRLFYTPRDSGRRDPLNLVQTLKACEDGLVDAGVMPDDSLQAGHQSVMPEITPKGSERPGGNRLWLVVTRLA